MMDNFIEALTQELRTYQDETTWLSSDVVHGMLIRAAAKSIKRFGGPEMNVRIWREIEPELMEAVTVVELKDRLDHVNLFPEEVTLLRALLLSYDESDLPRIGEPLTMATRLRDGRVVSQVVKEMLEND